jgi:hypothetical protein
VKVLSPIEFDAQGFEAETQQIRTKHPLYSLTEEPKAPSFLALISRSAIVPQEQILKYNSILEEFYTEYEKYLRAVHDHQNMARRLFRLEIVLDNGGSSPADDVDIDLHFPDGFQLFDAEDDDVEIPEPPKKPDPPQKPGTWGSTLDKKVWAAMQNPGIYGIQPRLPGPPRNVSSPSIRRTNSYDVELHIRRAKHQNQISVACFLAVFDSYETANSFVIDYSICAANLPKKLTGELSVVVERE